MIPERYITEWSEQAPWVVNKFIEQDLIVCRALVSIYSDTFLAEHLAFRGGTASHLPTYKEFLLNMDGKLQDEEFLTDTEMILGPQVEYDPQVAWEKVKAELVERLNPEV